MFFTGDHSPVVVLYLDSIDQVGSIWTSASDYEVPIVNLGAGLSYTAGVLPNSSNTALLDLSKLTKVSPPNLTDRVITVEAGVRWQMIDELLANGCYRLAIPPPISGSRLTVGGAIAQGLPVGLESVIGLEVVIPGGELLKIGACHWGDKQRGCHRMMGADLIGLFMGSGGILGTIVRAHLRLEAQPKIVSHRSYSTRNLTHSAEVITKLSATEANPLLIALSVKRVRDIATIGVREKIKLAWNTLRSFNTNGARLKLFFNCHNSALPRMMMKRWRACTSQQKLHLKLRVRESLQNSMPQLFHMMQSRSLVQCQPFFILVPIRSAGC